MSVDVERQRLEKLYNQRPPVVLIANIFVSALIGSTLTTVAIRAGLLPLPQVQPKTLIEKVKQY